MSNFTRQNEVNKAKKLLNVQQPLLESSSEMDKSRCDNQYGAFSSHQNYCDGDKFSFSRILSDREYQLTEPWSAKIVDKVVERSPKMQYIFKENLHTSVKILQICMDLQDSVQRSLQNPAEKILQICSDSQISKTWIA